MNESRIRGKLKKLSKDCERLARRVEIGLMTETEKRRKANELANEYLRLSRKARKLSNPYVGAYIEQACYRVGLQLKYIAAKTAEPVRKGLEIKRKVVNPAKEWRR